MGFFKLVASSAPQVSGGFPTPGMEEFDFNPLLISTGPFFESARCFEVLAAGRFINENQYYTKLYI